MLDLALNVNIFQLMKNYIMKNLKHLLQFLLALLTSSSYSNSEALSCNSITYSKITVESIKCKRKKTMNILKERKIVDKLFDYFHDSQVKGSRLHALQWWCQTGSI